MRKLKLLIAIILTACITFTLGACKSAKTEIVKFNGYISSQAYSSAKEAAEAYYNEQIKGGDYEGCEYRGYTYKKDLAKNEINGLNLGAIQAGDVLHGERGKVSFVYGNEVFNNSINVIQTANGFYYYTLEPKDEEAVCYDFYNHLVSTEALSNFTVKTTAMIVSEQDGYSRQTEVVLEYLYSGNNVQYEAVVRRIFSGGISEVVYSGYILYGEDDLAIYGINDKGQYVDITTDDSKLFVNSNKNDAYMVNMMSQFYRYGHNLFKVDEDRYVLRNIEEETLARYFESLYYLEEEGSVKAFSYNMTVANQRISSTAMNIHSTNEDESQILYVSIESTFSKYGETQFIVPEDVKSLWNAR